MPTKDEMQYRDLVSLSAQDELMEDIILKTESILKNSQDLMYLTSESALKLMHNRFLVMRNRILSSKHKLMREMIKEDHK